MIAYIGPASLFLNGIEYKFNKQVQAYVVYDDNVIIIFTQQPTMVDKEKGGQRNVESYNQNGVLLWKIEPYPGSLSQASGGYTELAIRGDAILAKSEEGDWYSVDPMSGHVARVLL